MKKYIGILLVAVLLVVNITFINAATHDKNQIITYLDEVSRYELEHVSNPSYGSLGGEWTVIGLARYGTISDNYIAIYKTNLTNKLKSCEGVLSARKYTEYARVTIALTAIEENPENFAGYNLLKPLAELENVISQGANGILYTLIALDCGDYSVPEPDKSYKGEKTTREKLVRIIIDNQLEDGGWSLMGTKSDTDITAITIQALAPYYNKEEKVKKAVNQGLDRLSELQQKDGGYKTGEFANCESTAQVLTSLSLMNVSLDDSRFVKNGNTVIDGLMKYYKDGGFSHFADGDVNQMATEQAMFSLVAYYRSLSGMNGLFEMTDGITKRELPVVNALKNSNSSTKDNKVNKSSSTKNKNEKKTNSNKSTNEKKTIKINDVKNAESETFNIEETQTKNQKTRKEKEDKRETTLEIGTQIENVTLAETEVASENSKVTKTKEENGVWIIVIVAVLIIIGAVVWVIYKKVKSEEVQK